MYPIVANPGLYLRKQDGSPSEPLNAATFHQIGRQLHDIILDLERLHIANSDKSERWSRKIIGAEVTGATHAMALICQRLERVQDNPTPYACTRCHGSDAGCDRCDGTGLVDEPVRK